MSLHAHSSGSEKRNLPWVEKYRPSDMDDVIAHRDIIATRKDGRWDGAGSLHRRVQRVSALFVR